MQASSSTHSIDLNFEQAFCLAYFFHYETWWNTIVFFLILWGVGTVEGLVKAYRKPATPGETWILVGNELRQVE